MEDDLLENKGALGISRFRPRDIGIDSGAGPESQWQTFGHEITHVALWDGGVHDSLSDKQIEAVCSALGTYIAAAVQAGYMKVVTPRSPR